MRQILYALLLLLSPVLSFGQTCDTLYSHEKYVERSVEIGYRGCHLVVIDSIYRVVQWLNVDTNFLETHFSENKCETLYNSITGKRIHEIWQVEDTVFKKVYYGSGKLKSISKNVFGESPDFFDLKTLIYYENGALRYEGEYKSSSFTTHTTYYPNGVVETRAKRFGYNTNAFGEYTEYFPNGQPSRVALYTEPDTLSNQFQGSILISEKFFDEAGREVEQNLNEYKKLYVKVYPPMIHETANIGDNLYTMHQFSDQEAYSNDMKVFKQTIRENMILPEGANCMNSVGWISLTVSKKGMVELMEVQFENESVKQSIESSILTIKKWPPAVKDGVKVDTYIYTYLIIAE